MRREIQSRGRPGQTPTKAGLARSAISASVTCANGGSSAEATMLENSLKV